MPPHIRVAAFGRRVSHRRVVLVVATICVVVNVARGLIADEAARQLVGTSPVGANTTHSANILESDEEGRAAKSKPRDEFCVDESVETDDQKLGACRCKQG